MIVHLDALPDSLLPIGRIVLAVGWRMMTFGWAVPFLVTHATVACLAERTWRSDTPSNFASRWHLRPWQTFTTAIVPCACSDGEPDDELLEPPPSVTAAMTAAARRMTAAAMARIRWVLMAMNIRPAGRARQCFAGGLSRRPGGYAEGMAFRFQPGMLLIPPSGRPGIPAGSAVMAERAQAGPGGTVMVACRVAAPDRRGASYADLARACERGNCSRALLPASELTLAGHWDAPAGAVKLRQAAAADLSAWLGRRVHRGDLEASDSLRSVRQDARMRARRLHLQGRSAEAMALRARHGVPHW